MILEVAMLNIQPGMFPIVEHFEEVEISDLKLATLFHLLQLCDSRVNNFLP